MPEMKFNRFLIILILIGNALFAQSKKIEIPWSEPNITGKIKSISGFRKESQKNIPQSLNLRWDENGPTYSYRWPDQFSARPGSQRIKNIIWAEVNDKEKQRLASIKLPSQFGIDLNASMARNQWYSVISFNPYVRVNGKLQKIQSFMLDYDFGLKGSSQRVNGIVNSVLAEGEWFKFQISETGVYRLDRNFLDGLGMNLTQIDPSLIKIYGHGGKPLPLLNSDNLYFDIPEVPIKVIGGEDGSFDSGDYILFYGQGVMGFDEENDSHFNPYSNETYYFITANGAPGLRIGPMLEPSGLVDIVFEDYQSLKYHESDQYSPAKVGRRWFGNRFDIQNQQEYSFHFPGRISTYPIQVKVRAAAASEVPTSLQVSVNGTSVDPLNFNPINDPTLLSVDSFVQEFQLSSETINVAMSYNNSGNPSSIGYLDYVQVTATLPLRGNNSTFEFYNEVAATSTGIGLYQISQAQNIQEIWAIEDPIHISSKLNESESETFSFKTVLGTATSYVAITSGDYLEPTRPDNYQVVNQNIKGTLFNGPSGFQDIDYLIVTPRALKVSAEQLATHHRMRSNLSVRVVTTEDIYTEFSSGKQDISAVRNLVRYVYDNASSPFTRLNYLCLFGDTSVDFKDRLSGNNNMVPTYHTLSSVDTFNSFMSDDFFGMMDPDEGTMSSSHSLDLAVGRILVDDPAQAQRIVTKITSYNDESSFGQWRNNFVIISDDVDIGWEYRALEVTLDSIADRVSAEKPFINVKKIHTDAFQQETSAGGNRYPEAREAIENAIEVGALVVNYFGHGGEDGLAKEFIYTKETAQNLRNDKNYPCFVTVTCEFSKFDNPLRITAGELTFWNEQGGAGSLITTTRSVSVTLGVDFNTLLSEYLFGFGQDLPPAPAEALRLTKNLIGSNNKRVIFYIGDPAMHLAFPKKQIRLTAINDKPLSLENDTLKALSRIKLSGTVLDPNGNLMPNYNGILEVKVFDKELERSTLGNDGVRDNGTDYDGDGNTTNLLLMDFKTLGEVMFNGQATVSQGEFDFEFIVPRDIQVPVGPGKVSFYSRRSSQFEDQTGYDLSLLVGSLNENAPQDNIGPEIELFMNDENFISGGTTNDNPILLVNLSDESGLNTTGGIGHDLIAILDGDTANPNVLNEYYQANVDDFTNGKAQFKLRDLSDGPHSLQVKAWDTYNNFSIATIDFIVSGGDVIKISNVLNYPNPFVDYTEFWFNHNRPFEPLDVIVQVFSVSGKLVWNHHQTVITEGYLSRDIIWDGRDDFGDKIGKGVYVYKLSVRSSLSGKRAEKYEKLVIL